MKVLYTLDSLNRGGTETLVLDICRNASRFGIDLTFAATGGGDLEEEFELSGVPYIRLDRELPLDLSLVWRLRQIIKETGIEIVHGHQPVEALHLYLATLGTDVKRVLTHHGGGTRISEGKNKYTARFLARKMNANIACGRGMFPWLREEVGLDTTKNFFLIHNGVDSGRLQPSGDSFKAELGVPDDHMLMGMVANFIPTYTKDQLTVCRALPAILAEIENAAFVFVGRVSEGSEEYFEECVRICDDAGLGDKVFFTGKRDDVPDILNSLDIFVFSTLREGLPISLIEAMLAGVPVLATDIEPVRETTDDGSCIAMFTPKDADGLSEKAINLLKDKGLRTELAGKAKEHAIAHFSIETHLGSLKKLYADLLEDK